MRRLESLRNDWVIVRQMLRGIPRNGTHAENLQQLYLAQAHGYDHFRERLLFGRAEMISRLTLPTSAYVVELGGGTGRNVEYFGERLRKIASFDLVDLCPALLNRARERFSAYSQVHVIEADATEYRPPALVDCVYFSYSLTMIPDWRAALANALSLLKPGGVLGVVDFYHSTSSPDAGMVRHGAFARTFWPRWFAHDGVRLNPNHLATLRALLPRHELVESLAPVPYLPVRVPYYTFIGRKTAEG